MLPCPYYYETTIIKFMDIKGLDSTSPGSFRNLLMYPLINDFLRIGSITRRSTLVLVFCL